MELLLKYSLAVSFRLSERAESPRRSSKGARMSVKSITRRLLRVRRAVGSKVRFTLVVVVVSHTSTCYAHYYAHR